MSGRPICTDRQAPAGPWRDSCVLCCRSSNSSFREVLREIEKKPACGGLPMISFLILPMQRVTRLPLLTDVSMQPGQLAGRWPGHSRPLARGNPPNTPPPHLVVCMNGSVMTAVTRWWEPSGSPAVGTLIATTQRVHMCHLLHEDPAEPHRLHTECSEVSSLRRGTSDSWAPGRVKQGLRGLLPRPGGEGLGWEGVV